MHPRPCTQPRHQLPVRSKPAPNSEPKYLCRCAPPNHSHPSILSHAPQYLSAMPTPLLVLLRECQDKPLLTTAVSGLFGAQYPRHSISMTLGIWRAHRLHLPLAGPSTQGFNAQLFPPGSIAPPRCPFFLSSSALFPLPQSVILSVPQSMPQLVLQLLSQS